MPTPRFSQLGPMPDFQPDKPRVPLLYRVELDFINDVLSGVRDGDMDDVEEAVEDTLGQLRDKDDPASFLHGQPTFEAMLHLVAALGLWRLDDLDASVEHLRRAHAMASSSTNPRHRRRYKDVMRRARSMAGLPDYPTLEEFPMNANSPRWGYPPQMVVDDDGETRLVMPESNRWPAFEAIQATPGTSEALRLAEARVLASFSQETPSSPGTTAVSLSGTHGATLPSSFTAPAPPDLSDRQVGASALTREAGGSPHPLRRQ